MTEYEQIEKIIRYLKAHREDQPGLETLAESLELSPHQLHRLFRRWAGVTPKAFLKCLTMSHAKERLLAGASVLDASLSCGLSGPGRLHDLCVNLEAASPGELKSGGEDWTIATGVSDSPFGRCLIAESPRGICHLSFITDADPAHCCSLVSAEWPAARVIWDDTQAAQTAKRIFLWTKTGDRQEPLQALVRGTAFQVKVWRALLSIPTGKLASYSTIAAEIGKPTAARAVGSAVGQNRLAFLIPCHRVIRETGVIGNYRWGNTRKRAMIAWETSPALPNALDTTAEAIGSAASTPGQLPLR